MRILIAEDDPKLLKTLVHIFEMNHSRRRRTVRQHHRYVSLPDVILIRKDGDPNGRRPFLSKNLIYL